MKPSEEIKKYSSDEDKPMLLWLISQYHMASNWPFVAKCSFSGGRYPNNYRIWSPTPEGRVLYANRCKLLKLKESQPCS